MSSLIFNSKYFDMSSYHRQSKVNKASPLAIELYKKLSQKMHIQPNNIILTYLKNENLHIYFDILSLKDSQILSRVISNHFYFKSITLSPNDPYKLNSSKPSKESGYSGNNKNKQVHNLKEKQEQDKLKKEEEKNFKVKLHLILTALIKHLKLTNELLTIKLLNLNFTMENSALLAKGLRNNDTINNIIINGCAISDQSLDTILECFLTHNKIENIELNNNNLNDKSCNMFGRIITRQTQLRDQIIWMYGLRNEKPLNNDYTKGLISINLANNNLTSKSCQPLVNALSYDNYIRKISLKENIICEEGCHLFNKLLKTNASLLNVDLRKNPGFNYHFQTKIYFKLARNITNITKMNNLTKDEIYNLSKYICFEYFSCEITQESK